MKIAFIGSHGVGKTGLTWSLAGVLKKDGHSVELLPEASRLIADSGQEINENSTEKAQKLILNKQIQLENYYSTKYEIVICDRSVIDNFIYLYRVLKKMKLKKAEFDKKFKIYEDMIKEHYRRSSYDYIFYVPMIKKKIESNDSYRSKNIKFRQEIDLMLRDYLRTSRILLSGKKTRFISLPAKNSDRWNKIVRDSILV